ncbi:hypothetical protein [Escherichia coli]|uniref:hypothetical protein n=1 Tax=Escherichia coli TaxID=562 RepID=UPI00202CAA3D|nr:hypothetical protein [Escherichia coli]
MTGIFLSVRNACSVMAFFIFSRLAIIMVYFSVYRRIETVITYADIREKQAEIQEARQEYIQRLRDMAKRLVKTYEDSLALPKPRWLDIDGNSHPYVYLSHDSCCEKPEDLQVDFQDGVTFNLYTVVDDDPRQSVSVNITVSILLIDGDNMTISVDGYQARTFSHVDTNAKINEVCEYIKDSILMSMNEVTFGKKSLSEVKG